MPMTPLPATPPSTADPANFDARMDSLLGALPLFITEANAVEVAVDADAVAAAGARSAAESAAAASAAGSTLVSTCTTSVTLSNAAKALTIQAGKAFVDGYRAVLVRASDRTSQGSGIISGHTTGGTTMTLTIDRFVGVVGPFTDWFLVADPFAALPVATTADIRVGTQGLSALTPAGLYNAAVEVNLVDAATVAVDMNSFQNAALTMTSGVGATRTLGAPTNAKPGQTGRIRVIQDVVGSRALTYHANWKREGGAGPLTTTANANDYIYFDVIAANLIVYNLVRSPS